MPRLSPQLPQDEPSTGRLPDKRGVRVGAIYARCRLGQWGLIGFLLLSLVAYWSISWFAVLPWEWRHLLGPSPPVRLIGIALAIYAFAALIHILARMMEGGLAYRGWVHLGYTAGFYLFYGYSGALEENFWAVFVAGLTIFGLEYYRLWSQCSEALRREQRVREGTRSHRPRPPKDGM